MLADKKILIAVSDHLAIKKCEEIVSRGQKRAEEKLKELREIDDKRVEATLKLN